MTRGGRIFAPRSAPPTSQAHQEGQGAWPFSQVNRASYRSAASQGIKMISQGKL